MEHPEIREDALLVIIVHPSLGEGDYDLRWRTVDRNKAIDALYTYITDGVKMGNPYAAALAEILISVSEGVKADFPGVAAAVRKMNLDKLREKQEQSDQPNSTES